MPDLRTERLRMVPFTLELVRAALHDTRDLSDMLGVAVPASWPGPDFADIMPMIAERLASNPDRARWGGLIIHSADQTLIGDMGLKGGPDEHGTVEIGYSIVPERRGQGYAVEMARALIVWARAQPGVRRIVAECEPDNHASIRVLEKLGMHPTPPRDGMLWWELSEDVDLCRSRSDASGI